MSTALWIPKHVWFFFLLDRARALKQMQNELFKRQPRPPNYVILCGLISYLMQALTSTPVNVPSFVTDALYVLDFGVVMAKFGTFFLHELDLRRSKVLPRIREKDTPGIEFQGGIKLLPTKVNTVSSHEELH